MAIETSQKKVTKVVNKGCQCKNREIEKVIVKGDTCDFDCTVCKECMEILAYKRINFKKVDVEPEKLKKRNLKDNILKLNFND